KFTHSILGGDRWLREVSPRNDISDSEPGKANQPVLPRRKRARNAIKSTHDHSLLGSPRRVLTKKPGTRAANGEGSIYRVEGRGYRGYVEINGRRKFFTAASKAEASQKKRELL